MFTLWLCPTFGDETSTESLGLFGSMTLFVGALSPGLGLLRVLHQGFSLLRCALVLGCLMLLVPVAFSISYLKNPDSFVFARWILSTSEAKCLRLPSADMLELLALQWCATTAGYWESGLWDVGSGTCVGSHINSWWMPAKIRPHQAGLCPRWWSSVFSSWVTVNGHRAVSTGGELPRVEMTTLGVGGIAAWRVAIAMCASYVVLK
jgi:hypothetical protein